MGRPFLRMSVDLPNENNYYGAPFLLVIAAV
jgi:hypothetical protein